MPAPRRSRSEPTEDWAALQLRFQWPEQTGYELIRPVVLFGFTAAERARQTGISARTIARKANRFDTLGLQGLAAAEEAAESKRRLPLHIRRAIAELVVEYPAFRPHELATICYVRFNRRPGAPTIQRVRAEEPAPTLIGRRFPPYGDIGDPMERRAAIVRLHTEGWNIASIAGYLHTTRPTVYATLKRWIAEGVQGLADKPSSPKHLVRKTDLAAMNAVRKLQVNPELGAFRIHAALLRLGIRLSPRTCGRILALNRKLNGLPGPAKLPHAPQERARKTRACCSSGRSVSASALTASSRV